MRYKKMSQKHNITISKTANFYTLGDVKSATTIWLVLHGYGYLAKNFIEKFRPIFTKNTLVVAPEALSKFYVKGVDGSIGASWMTKENREEEIADYINYLNQLYVSILKQVAAPNPKINIVGFSQGGATASRWIAASKINCDNFILWASVFPTDMDIETIVPLNTFFLYGNQDKYVTEERVKQQKEIFKKSGLKIKTILFKGKHDIPKAILVEQAELSGW